MKKSAQPSREAAEMLAIQALAFIAEDEERLSAFVSVSGLAPDAIRDAAQEPGFLTGVIEHMLGDENLLIAFADRAGIDPAAVAQARRALGGTWERDVT
jgi:hypothetical protein